MADSHFGPFKAGGFPGRNGQGRDLIQPNTAGFNPVLESD